MGGGVEYIQLNLIDLSKYLCWISPLDLSQARDGYPNMSAGPVSCRGWIS